MTDEPVSGTMKDLWQTQIIRSVTLAPNELRHRSKKLRAKVLWRNLREDLGAAFVVVIFGYYYWKFATPLLRLGSGLTMAGAIYVIYQLHARGSARMMPLEMGLHTCLDFHKKELERQRDLLRSVWSWYLLPFVPGLFVFLLGIAVAQSATFTTHVESAIVVFGLSIACVFIVFFAIWKLNQWAAQKLQLQIDAIVAAESESNGPAGSCD